MNFNKKEKKLIINLLNSQVRENPYDSESRKLLKKINESEEKTIRDIKLAEDSKHARRVIRSFYDAGVIPTIDAGKLTSKDIKRMADFFELTIEADKTTENLFEDIDIKEFNDYEEDFKPYIMEYVRNMIILSNKMKQIKERSM